MKNAILPKATRDLARATISGLTYENMKKQLKAISDQCTKSAIDESLDISVEDEEVALYNRRFNQQHGGEVVEVVTEVDVVLAEVVEVVVEVVEDSLQKSNYLPKTRLIETLGKFDVVFDATPPRTLAETVQIEMKMYKFNC